MADLESWSVIVVRSSLGGSRFALQVTPPVKLDQRRRGRLVKSGRLGCPDCEGSRVCGVPGALRIHPGRGRDHWGDRWRLTARRGEREAPTALQKRRRGLAVAARRPGETERRCGAPGGNEGTPLPDSRDRRRLLVPSFVGGRDIKEAIPHRRRYRIRRARVRTTPEAVTARRVEQRMSEPALAGFVTDLAVAVCPSADRPELR